MNIDSVDQAPATRKKVKGYLATGIPLASAVFVVVMIILLLLHFIYYGAPGITWEFLTQSPRNNNTEGGIFPAIYGTAFLVLIMSLMGVPIGTATAVYLSEYARQSSYFARAVRFGVNSLAGVPSIVFGLFGVGFFIQFIGKGMDSATGSTLWGKPSLIWAAATLSVLTLPVVIVAVEEALRNVPQELRAASLALGATRWQTVWRVVLPNSLTGILTGSILAVGRGAGEVAPVIFVGAVYSLPQLPDSITDQFMHMGYHIYVLATQSPNVQKALPQQYATTLVLLLLAFSLNLGAAFIRIRIRRKSK
jgi:phosphate transport system permease protein